MKKLIILLCFLPCICTLTVLGQSTSNLNSQIYQSMRPDTLLIGSWEGQVLEDGRPYSIAIVIEKLTPGQYAGTTTYSGRLDCKGLLTFQRQRAGLFEFKENINSGNGCADGGRIELWFNSDGTLQFEWHNRQNKPVAVATVERK